MENDQQNKEIKKVYTDGEVCTLLEDIKGEIKAIAEGHQFLDKNIGDINKNIEEINTKLGKLDAIDIKLGEKAEKEVVDKHEERIVKLEKAVAIA